MEINVLNLLKEGKYEEASKLLPVWLYNLKEEKSYLLTDITSRKSLKTNNTTVAVHLKNYREIETYSHMGEDGEDSCYGATLSDGSYQGSKTIRKKIDEFLKDTYIVDEEATPKQKKALENFGEVVIKMSKKEAYKILHKLIGDIEKEKSYSKWDHRDWADDNWDVSRDYEDCF